MNRAGFAAALILAAGVGFLAGRLTSGDEGGRGDGRAEVTRAGPAVRVELAAEEFAEWRKKVARTEDLEAENRRLQEELRRSDAARQAVQDAAAELGPGDRRPDGSIVGGATWSPMTKSMAVGFLDLFVEQFFEEANLTEHQRQKLRKEMETRINSVMQLAADFVNGDATGDEIYGNLEGIADEGRGKLREFLDDRQYGIYLRFESGMGDFVRNNVVSTETTALRTRLGLDSEQEKNLKRVLEDRYRRVSERLGAPIPNMFFKALRRESDADIYAETSKEIRGYLRPEQVPAFLDAEANAMVALQEEYRKMLIPRPPTPSTSR